MHPPPKPDSNGPISVRHPAEACENVLFRVCMALGRSVFLRCNAKRV